MKVAQSCPTLCNPMVCTVHEILQARILEWVAFPFSKGSSQPRDWTKVSHIAGRFFTSWATREAKVLNFSKYFYCTYGDNNIFPFYYSFNYISIILIDCWMLNPFCMSWINLIWSLDLHYIWSYKFELSYLYIARFDLLILC